VPKTAIVLTTTAALTRERRTSRRLRVVIESLRDEIRATRQIVEMTSRTTEVNVTRLGQLQSELDRLKTSKS
jgi:hypothetical protein